MWVRGLKPTSSVLSATDTMSHPMWVRGLKRFVAEVLVAYGKSHPMWVRGLKLGTGAGVSIDNWSHPMWVRGLKLIIILLPISIFLVAPHVGAWIETASNLTIDTDTKGRTPCGCVD